MENSDKKFKVTDRRRFDSAGSEKEPESAEKVKEPLVEKKTKTSEAIEGPGFTAKEAAPEAEVDMAFVSLVHSLGAQAMMQLGELPPPDGVPVVKDVPAAKQSIDWLEMISVKSKGNLTQQESYFLEELLHSLHISYLKNK